MKKQNFLKELVVLSTLFLLAVITSIFLRLNFFISIFFFYGLPAVYLSFLSTRSVIVRTLFYSIPLSILGTIFIDHIAVVNHVWYVPTIFNFRILGTVPIEDIFWSLTLNYLIIIFYQHFFDRKKHKIIGKNLKYFFLAGIPLFAIFLFCIFTKNPILTIDYWYLKVGIFVILLPIVIFALMFPRFLLKIIKTSPYFFVLGFAQEIVAQKLGYWHFISTQFIGWVNLAGVRFPHEELFFWLMIFSTSVLCGFEFFDDDCLLKKR